MLRTIGLALLVACAGAVDPVDPPDTGEDSDGVGPDTDETDETDSDDSGPADSGSDWDTDDKPGPPRFDEEAAGRGLDVMQSTDDDPQRCNGADVHAGGGAVGDVNGDGFEDVVIAAYGGRTALFLNRGDGTFLDATRWSGLAAPGHASGGALADFDGDGDLDLTLGFVDQGFLQQWINRGDGRFVESASLLGLTPPSAAHRDCPMIWGLAWGDPDRDEDLDLMMGTWYAQVRPFPATENAYYRQDLGRFRDVAADVGLYTARTWTFSPGWADLDGDGWLDQALTSDFYTNKLFLGGPAGTFREVAKERGVFDVENGMGSQLVDWDDDGDLDWLITSIFDARAQRPGGWGGSGNRVYLNDGAGWFSDGTDRYGLRESGWAWGIVAFDADNDGDLDLAVTNGHTVGEGGEYLVEPFLDDPTQLWIRDGSGVLVDRARELGVDHTGQGRALVAFDVENDGDLDLLLIGWGERPRLWINRLAAGRHWLRVRLRQAGGNSRALGATVWVKARGEDRPRRAEIHANPAYLATGPAEAHFGLGSFAGPLDEVRVVWPDGAETAARDVPVDQILTLERP